MRVVVVILVTIGLLESVAWAQPEISPSEIFDIAISGVGSPYVWGGGCWDPSDRSRLGADCSGYVGKVWQIPERSDVTTCAHPYTTWSFYNESTHWDPVDRDDAQPVDAFVYNDGSAGHIVLYEAGDPWGNAEVYEARGTAYGIVHRTRTFDSSYRVRRRRNLIGDGPPPHPELTLATAVDSIDGQARDFCTLSGSTGLFDAYVGQWLTERLYVANEGAGTASDVVVGIEVTSSALNVEFYEIFDDWDGHDCGTEWCSNDANDDPHNPAHDDPGRAFFLHLGAISAGETKMIVLDLSTLEATFGDVSHPEVRIWVWSVADYYSKESYGSSFDNVGGYQTFNGGDLRASIGQTVIGDELCNSLDDDCDGRTDEDFTVGQPCSTGVGSDAIEGVFICFRGDVVCDGVPVGSSEEVCGNGVDDDRDGLTDEGCLVNEICDNGVDDDYDGRIDEGCGEDEVPTTDPYDPDPTDPTGTNPTDPAGTDPSDPYGTSGSSPVQGAQPGGLPFGGSLGMTGGCACSATPSGPGEGGLLFGVLCLALLVVRRADS